MTSIYDEYIPPAIHIERAKKGLPVTKESLADPVYIYIPFTDQGLIEKQRGVADDIEVGINLLPPERLHMTLLWAEHCPEGTLAAIISGLAMPIRFGIEIARLDVLKGALVWVAVPDPALMRLQSDLYRRALNEGIELSEYSPPKIWTPHISIAYDCVGLPEILPQIKPFKLDVDRFIVGRYDYEKVYTVHLARAMGDRVLVEQGEVLRHAAPIHPGTGTDQDVHGGGGATTAVEDESGGPVPFTESGRRKLRGKHQELIDFFRAKLEDEVSDSRSKVAPFVITDIGDTRTIRVLITPTGKVFEVDDHDPVANRLWKLAEDEGLVSPPERFSQTSDVMQKITGNPDSGDAKSALIVLGFTRGTIQQNDLSFETATPTSRATKRAIGRMLEMAEVETISPSFFLDVNTVVYGLEVYVEDYDNMIDNRTIKAWLRRHAAPIHRGTEVTKSELMALMRGEIIIHSLLRRAMSIEDGPFAIRRHSRKRCMNCKKPPEVAVHWANNHGRAWFCLKDFETWVKEEDRDLTGVWFIEDGQIPENLQDIGSKDKVRKLGEKLSTQEIMKRLKSLRERGGPVSGFEGHAGRPGEVGGSQPRDGAASQQDVGMKQAKPTFTGKKKLFGKEHHTAFNNMDTFADDSDFAELYESVVNDGEWPWQAGQMMEGLLEESVTVGVDEYDDDVRESALEKMTNEATEEKMNELYNRAGSYLDLPISPDDLVGMSNSEIEEEMRSIAWDKVEGFEDDDITDYIVDGNLDKEFSAVEGAYYGYDYRFGRNDGGEIVSAMMIENDNGWGERIGEWIDQVFDGSDDDRLDAVNEAYDGEFINIKWLASKYHGNGYGTQMMAEAFQHAASQDAGVFLTAAEGAESFYDSFDPTAIHTSQYIWTPSKVMELAEQSTEESFTGKSLMTREALADVKIGGEEIEDREDLEPLGGAFVVSTDKKKAFPRAWKKKIEKEQGLGFISDDDMRVLGSRDVLSKIPEGNFGMFSATRDELMRGVRKSLEGLILNVMGWVGRHGDHVDQEGRSPEAGGSKEGYTHVGAEGGGGEAGGKTKDGKPQSKVKRGPQPASYEDVTPEHKEQWRAQETAKVLKAIERGEIVFGEMSRDEFAPRTYRDMDYESVEFDKANAEYYARRDIWDRYMGEAVSTGQITPERADELGWSSSQGGIEWVELPDALYHVTTATSAVLSDRLKSRRELGQDDGKGLGGGEDTTISFTDDPEMANSIYHAIIEARQVASGELTIEEMLDQAIEGDGAPREWASTFMSFWGQENWQEGDEIPIGLQGTIDGVRRAHNFLTDTEESYNERELDDDDIAEGLRWSPDTEREEARGKTRDDDRHVYWIRDLTEDEQREQTFETYKRWAIMRQDAGGYEDPLFFSTDVEGLANINPDEIGIIQVNGNGYGYQLSALGEWRTHSGLAVDGATEIESGERVPREEIGEGSIEQRAEPEMIDPEQVPMEEAPIEELSEEEEIAEEEWRPIDVPGFPALGNTVGASGPGIDGNSDSISKMFFTPPNFWLLPEGVLMRVEGDEHGDGLWEIQGTSAVRLGDNLSIKMDVFANWFVDKPELVAISYHMLPRGNDAKPEVEQEEEQKIDGEEQGKETPEEQEQREPQEPQEEEPVKRHLKHEGQEGRPGSAGGSKPGFTHGGGGGTADDGKHKVGITSQKIRKDPVTGEEIQKPDELVFEEMKKFEEELRGIEDVGNINIGEARGGWRNEKQEIEHEAAWLVEFTGNGEAEKLIAQTAKKYDQAMVIWMDDCQPPGCETMVNYTMDSTVTDEMIDYISGEMGGLGYKGWTWFQGDGDRHHLRVGDPPKNGTEALNGFMDNSEIGYNAKDSPVRMRYWDREDIEEHAGEKDQEE